MKERNPEAICRTCPYWGRHDIPNTKRRRCHGIPSVTTKHSDGYCSLHPDFFVNEPRPSMNKDLLDGAGVKFRQAQIRMLKRHSLEMRDQVLEAEKELDRMRESGDKASEKPVCVFCKNTVSNETLAWRQTRRHGDAGWFCNENCARSWGALHEDTRTI